MVTASDSDSDEDEESRPEPPIKPASSSSLDTKKASVLTTDRGASVTALGAGRYIFVLKHIHLCTHTARRESSREREEGVACWHMLTKGGARAAEY
jgi:hypothetical protein